MLMALLGTIFCTLWLIELDTRTAALSAVRQHSADVATLMSQQVTHALSRGGREQVNGLLQELAGQPDILHARLVDMYGAAIAQYGEMSAPGSDTVRVRRDIVLSGVSAGYLDLSFSASRQLRESAFHSQRTALRLSGAIAIIFLLAYAGLLWLLPRPPWRDIRGAPTAPIESAPLDSPTVPRTRGHDKPLVSREKSPPISTRADHQEFALHTVTDPVTGLYDARYVERLLQIEIAPALVREETHSILLIAPDAGTRAVADAVRAPDEVMHEITQRVVPLLRQHDTLCRYRDHFFLLCRGATMATAVTIADQLQNTVTAEPVMLGARTLTVSLRIGVATVPGRQPVRTPQEFLRCAEEALAQAHDAGQNGIAHYSLLPHSRGAARRA